MADIKSDAAEQTQVQQPLNLTLSKEALAEISKDAWRPPNHSSVKFGDRLSDAGVNWDKEQGKLKIDTTSPGHDTWLQLGALSYHQNREANYNETNYGIGLFRRLDEERAVAIGYYKNSIHKDSFYAQYQYTPYEVAGVKLGLQTGLISGYKSLHGAPMPILLPLATIEGKRLAADITCIPPLGGVSAVCAAQLRVKLD